MPYVVSAGLPCQFYGPFPTFGEASGFVDVVKRKPQKEEPRIYLWGNSVIKIIHLMPPEKYRP